MPIANLIDAGRSGPFFVVVVLDDEGNETVIRTPESELIGKTARQIDALLEANVARVLEIRAAERLARAVLVIEPIDHLELLAKRLRPKRPVAPPEIAPTG